MLYIDNEQTKELHSIEEISANRKDASQVLDMMINASIPHQFGATDESIIENMKYFRFYLFKDTNGELLICPDLLEVEIDMEYEDENNAIVYDSVRRIVSYRDFNVALDEKGYKLDIQKIEELIPYVNGNVVDINVSKKACKRKMARM